MKTKLTLIALTLALIGYICAPWPGIPVALFGAALLSCLFSFWKKDKSLLYLAAVLAALALLAAAVLLIMPPAEEVPLPAPTPTAF
ncbi:MAG: hypothetical protein ACOYJE_01865 [Bacteroidaceae bacterium]|jgi:hypothetical protein